MTVTSAPPDRIRAEALRQAATFHLDARAQRFQLLVGLVGYGRGRRAEVALGRSHPWGLGVEWWADDDSFASVVARTYHLG